MFSIGVPWALSVQWTASLYLAYGSLPLAKPDKLKLKTKQG
jgi:hypothetical protein